jgi:hypothetical protein
MKLGGKKLDEFLAEHVMSWRRIGTDNKHGLPIYQANGNRTVTLCAWSPHADISAAFEVVARMRDLVHPCWFILEQRPAGFVCTFVRDGEYASGITAAEAVCRAALRALSNS